MMNLTNNWPDKIPVIDLNNSSSDEATLTVLHEACSKWGFFQVVNHGVDPQILEKTGKAWSEFFYLSEEEKKVYANLPPHFYEGFGSKLGVVEGAKEDQNFYFFLHLLPLHRKDKSVWPKIPSSLSNLIEESHVQLSKLAARLIKALSKSLGLGENQLSQALGGEKMGVYLKANYYPKSAQPADTIMGLSPHSDPGALTLLLATDNISGLQVLKGESWVTVEPVPNAIVINIGDQIQVLSNGIYKSSEHRVIANPFADRMSIAWFYNPEGDVIIEPMKELIAENSRALYPPQTFNEYITFMAENGPSGKFQVDSLKVGSEC